MARKCIVVMGVSTSGKSTIGAAIAEKLHYVFIDGDNLQPKQNIEKMTKGIPLADEDRALWLSKICTTVMEQNDAGEDCVVACAAIKKKYRNILRGCIPHVRFVYLKANFDLLYKRITGRKNHWMSPALLQSQFSALEEPVDEKDVMTVPINNEAEVTTNQIITALKGQPVA